MEKYLSIQDVSCGYKNSFKLNDINFSIPKGIFAGIVGPNGSGKTTLFKGITGELQLLGGSIFLNQSNMKAMDLKTKARNIAVVSQFINAIDITVEEYVLMGRLPYRKRFQFFETIKDRGIAEKYMKLTDIYHLKDKLMSNLSGGEQQLASIAKALSQEPGLLLLDEPTSHLDITHQVQTLNLLQQLNTELNLTVLMIIHDLNLAAEYCDYVIMMNKGKIFKQGAPEEIFNYKNIEDVYKTVVITETNPLSKRPAIFLVSDKILTRYSKNKK